MVNFREEVKKIYRDERDEQDIKRGGFEIMDILEIMLCETQQPSIYIRLSRLTLTMVRPHDKILLAMWAPIV
jgi:hypothetical protein